MITSVNNISFKSIIVPKYPPLSESQEKVLEDLKTKLGKKAETKHFLVTPLKDDVIELSQVYNVKEIGTGIDKKVRYSDPLFIGRYNEQNPFEMEDYKNRHKELAKDFGGLLSFICFLLPVMLGLLFLVTNKNQAPSQQTEKVTTVLKDSLESLKQDSLKIFK